MNNKTKMMNMKDKTKNYNYLDTDFLKNILICIKNNDASDLYQIIKINNEEIYIIDLLCVIIFKNDKNINIIENILENKLKKIETNLFKYYFVHYDWFTNIDSVKIKLKQIERIIKINHINMLYSI